MRLVVPGAARQRALDLAFLLPVLAVLAVFLLYPLVYGLDLSLHATEGFEVTSFVGIEHYVRALVGDAVFRQGIGNTLVFTAAAVVLQIAVGLTLAVLVGELKRGRTILRLVFFAPFVLASVAVGAVWKFMYAPFYGIVPSIGAAVGVDASAVAPLADAETALWAIILAFVWRFSGFAMVVYLAAMQSISRDYYEFAELEGAGRLERFRRITWPFLMPQTVALVLLSTIATLRIFDMVWIMTAGGPAHATETVATHVYVTAFRFLDVGYAQAMATILMVVILLLAVVEYWLLARRADAVAS